MSKQLPQPAGAPPAEALRAAPTPDGLDALLAERTELCDQLAARQVEFARVVAAQSRRIDELSALLDEAKGALAERYEEIARLSRLVLQLEDEQAREKPLSAKTAERLEALQLEHAAVLERERKHLARLAEREAALAAHERAGLLAEHALAARTAALDDANKTRERLEADASSLLGMLARLRTTRAWRLGRALTRETDITLPPTDAPFDPVAYQKGILRASDLFEPEWYLATYPGAAGSGMDPAEHYLRAGVLEGHNPGPRFDTVGYLRRYRDVRRSGMNPLVHYLEHGRAEGRAIDPAGDVKPAEAPAAPCN